LYNKIGKFRHRIHKKTLEDCYFKRNKNSEKTWCWFGQELQRKNKRKRSLSLWFRRFKEKIKI